MDTNGTSMGMSPYEQFMMAEKTSRHRASGTSITALVLGSVGLVAGVTSWIFAPIYANARAKAAEAQNAGTASLLQQTASLLAAERAERVQGDITLNATINDTVSGSQQGTLSATQQAQLDAYQQMLVDIGTGKYTENPTKVQLYSAPQPCNCPGTCG